MPDMCEKSWVCSSSESIGHEVLLPWGFGGSCPLSKRFQYIDEAASQHREKGFCEYHWSESSVQWIRVCIQVQDHQSEQDVRHPGGEGRGGHEADRFSYHWTIKEVELYEVSVCTFPAYQETNVKARSTERAEIIKRENEAWKAKVLKALKGE